ncbi:MAG: MFS transporter [Phycisphaerae bacterium]
MLVFVVESSAYFGVLTLMAEFLSRDLGFGDAWAGPIVSTFTMLVTLFMLGVGSYAESFGLRRALLAALALCVVGRTLYCMTPWVGGAGAALLAVVLGALLITALGEAIVMPVCYSGAKQYSDERTNSMAYGLMYAFMNAGIVGMGAISAWVRPGVQKNLDALAAGAPPPAAELTFFSGFTASGIQAVNWVCAATTAFTLVLFFVLMRRRVEGDKIRPDDPAALRAASGTPLLTRMAAYFRSGPFADARFLFFIFMLLPVRTMFAHQWLTMPSYILRAYPQGVADRMEWLVNWINPAIIFVGVPIATAFTRRINVYTMMIIGTFVSAAPTFLLCQGPALGPLIAYFVIFSIGEALWSARFLEYASELAPPGRVAQYMGLANIPWLLAKGTTGFYSGYLLNSYCPADTPQAELQTHMLWLIYGCIAMLSPIGLLLARRWVMKGFAQHAAK